MESVVSKSQQIQDLVHQMKTGEITKTQLFAELSKLQRSSQIVNSSSNAFQQERPEAPDTVRPQRTPEPISESQSPGLDGNFQSSLGSSSDDDVNVRGVRSSTARRRAEIQRLFDEKRKQHVQMTRSSESSVGSGNYSFAHASSPPQAPQEFQRYSEQRGTVQQPGVQYEQYPENPQHGPAVELLDPRKSQNHRYSNEYPEGSNMMERIREAKTRELMQQLEQQRMEECTFHPKITELPTSYTGKTEQRKIRLEDRTMRWKNQKMQEAARRQREQIQREMQECTFHPHINESSRIAAANSRSVDDVSPGDRLYGESKMSRKAMIQAKYRAEKEAELRRQCTFRPNINRRHATPVKSRYREEQYRGIRSSANVPAEEQELTFKPKVNAIPATMGSAQLYVSEKVFDRLSRPRAAQASDANSEPKEQQSGEGKVLDISTFLSSQKSGNADSGSQAQRRRPASASTARKRSVPQKGMSAAERRQRQEKFEQFLARQRQREARRQKKLHDVEQRNNPSYKPELCKKSVSMVKTVKQGNFMQRLAKDQIRKEQKEKQLELQRAKANNPECTFKPKITKAAQKMRPRSAAELSRGDSLRRETNTRLMKLKAEQDEIAGHSFQPNLNHNPQVEGRLKILTEPETYLQRLQREAIIFSEKQRKAIQEQEMKEFAECTFTPKVHDAPKYIKRIARSMVQSRQSRKAESVPPSRPDWR